MAQTIPDPLFAGGGGLTDPLLPPSGDNTGDIGLDGTRWARIRGSEVETGDLVMTRITEDGTLVRWRGIEHAWGIEWVDETTGKRYAQRLTDLPLMENS